MISYHYNVMNFISNVQFDEETKNNISIFLEKEKIENLSNVQVFMNEISLDNANLFIQSPTGSGKTLAFLLPLIKNLSSEKTTQALIIAPTEELSIQILNYAKSFLSCNKNINNNLLCTNGSSSLNRQTETIKKQKPSVIIGTPGRILQLLELKKIKINNIKYLIFDEIDKLSEKSYFDTIIQIRKKCLKYINLLAFSATTSNRLNKLLDSLSSDFIRKEFLLNDDDLYIPSLIKHFFKISERNERINNLRTIISTKNNEKWIVFAKDYFICNEIYEKLSFHNYKISRLYGRLSKQEKEKNLTLFKNNVNNVLITTDIASHGLHIDNVYGVINFSLPYEITDYIHRAGRCGRNNKKGNVYNLISKNEINKISSLENKLNIKIEKLR